MTRILLSCFAEQDEFGALSLFVMPLLHFIEPGSHRSCLWWAPVAPWCFAPLDGALCHFSLRKN